MHRNSDLYFGIDFFIIWWLGNVWDNCIYQFTMGIAKYLASLLLKGTRPYHPIKKVLEFATKIQLMRTVDCNCPLCISTELNCDFKNCKVLLLYLYNIVVVKPINSFWSGFFHCSFIYIYTLKVKCPNVFGLMAPK